MRWVLSTPGLGAKNLHWGRPDSSGDTLEKLTFVSGVLWKTVRTTCAVAGGFRDARFHSQHVALTIAAMEQGLVDPSVSVDYARKG